MTGFRQAENIQAFVARYFGIKAKDITGRARAKTISRARQTAIALCRELTGLSYPEIAWIFNIHHTSAIHAVQHADQDLLSEIREAMGEANGKL